MPLKQIRLDADLLLLAEQQKPQFLETSQYIGLLVQKALTGVDPLSTLGKPSRSLSSLNETEVLPSNKAVNKEKDVEISLRAEEAHIPAQALKKAKAKPTLDVPGNLFAHDDLIRSYWKAKPKTKTQPAWDLLMRELTKIQDNYGDDVVRDQLVLAEAQRFQSITLKNYEQFGVSRSNAPTQGTGRVDWEAIDKMPPMF